MHPSSETMNNAMNRTNCNSVDYDVMSSLGQVLSSVNLSREGDDCQRGFGRSHGMSHGDLGIQQQISLPHQGLSAAPYASTSWGVVGLSTNGAQSPHGLTQTLYNCGASPPKSTKENDALHNILYDSGIYDGGSTPPVHSYDRERNPSIDAFLSLSPSKTLGDDAFRVMHRTLSNPSLVSLIPNQESSNTLQRFKPLSSTAPSSRSESPLMVRSNGVIIGGGNSGYNQGNIMQQQHYPNQSLNSVTLENNAQLYGGTGLNGNLSGQLPNSGRLGTFRSSNTQQQQHKVQSEFMPINVPQQQAQVFYMAVPSSDGSSQILQPVQMVQLPGSSPTIMVPTSIGHGQPQSQALSSSNHQNNQCIQGQKQHSVILMQAVQGSNTMSSSLTPLFTQENGTGSNFNHYSYGNDLHQTSGYNTTSHFLGKLDSSDDSIDARYEQENSMDPSSAQNNLSSLYSSLQRPSLRELLGNVRRLSRDQVGCRLLQQALDEDGPSAASAILNEGLTFWAEAMVDPFGNYLFQKILDCITLDERIILVKSVSTRLVNASLNLHGTRSVQKIVEACAVDEESVEGALSTAFQKESDDVTKIMKKTDTAAKILTDALKPSASRLCIDSHGNHVIQRILLKLPYEYTSFIFDAVAACVEDVARHRHGCCVIQRCLDSRHSSARTHLVSKIVEKSLELMHDAYGNYVVQYVLDVCGDEEVHAICETVIGRVCLLATQKFSSNVMEKCFERCTDKVREEYLNELNISDNIRELMMDPFGNYVVQRALSVSTHAQAMRLVETMKPHLVTSNGVGGIRNTAGGRRILGKICRRFPNFALEGETFDDCEMNQVQQRISVNNSQGGGGRRGSLNCHGSLNSSSIGSYAHSTASPVQRRHSRSSNRGSNVPQYPPQPMHNINFHQTDMIPYHQSTDSNPFMLPPNL